MNQTTPSKYSLTERLKQVKKTRWIRFSIVALLYIGWTIWLNNYYVLFGLLLLIDIYPPQYIPWGVVEKEQKRCRASRHGMGRRHRLRIGVGLFYLCLYFPELPNPLLVTRKVDAGGRFSTGQ